MATLTYDPTPADQPEFTPEEQESIALGEQLEQQQNQLLAGKYQNAQELEKAYVELQRKLGGQSEDETEDVSEEAEQEETEEETEEVEETEEEEQEVVTMSQDDIDALKGMVGGDEAYSEMMEWASENISEDEQQIYDYVMNLDDPWAAFFAVKALQNKYVSETGYEGEMLTGRSAPVSRDVFRSQAEVVQAMSDPRYDSDPAYRNDVFEKLERSENLQF